MNSIKYYGIKQTSDTSNEASWVVIDDKDNLVSSGCPMSKKDAQTLMQSLQNEMYLQARLDGILKPDCPSPVITNKNVLEEANQLIYGDRAQAYGPVTASFTRIAKFWSVILDTEVTAEQVGLCMIALKMSRQISRDGRDNLVDGAGYFGCIAKMKEENPPQ